jgi:hypothetical protein
MDAIIKECINHLNKGSVIVIQNNNKWYVAANANNYNIIFTLTQLPFTQNEKACILLAEPLQLLQYVASPPIDFDDFLEQNKNKQVFCAFTDVLNIDESIIEEREYLNFNICSENFVYTLCKRYKQAIITLPILISDNLLIQQYAANHNLYFCNNESKVIKTELYTKYYNYEIIEVN